MTDLLSVCIVSGVSLLLRFGVRTTSYLNNALSFVNLAVIGLLIVVGGTQARLSNWQLPGRGFLPFGWKGVFAASGSCFYAFVGFESVAAAGEEATNPQRSIPLATLASMAFATCAYVSVSAVLTLMQPYDQLSGESGLPDAIGLMTGGAWAKWAVVLGACCGMASVLIGTLYALTRIVYAMSEDTLLPRSFGQLDGRAQVPLRPMYVCAAVAALGAAVFPLTTLVEMMSIGTLLAYTLVSASVIILRYRPDEGFQQFVDKEASGSDGVAVVGQRKELPHRLQSDGSSHPVEEGDRTSDFNRSTADCQSIDGVEDNLRPWRTFREQFDQICHRLKKMEGSRPPRPGLIPASVAVLIVLMFTLCWAGPGWLHHTTTQRAYWIPILVCSGGIFMCGVVMACHRQINLPNRYRVPLVPLIPVMSIMFNVTLMANLGHLTWLRLVVWMQAGLFVYFLYTVRLAPTAQEFWKVRCETRSWGSMDSPTSCLSDTNEEGKRHSPQAGESVRRQE